MSDQQLQQQDLIDEDNDEVSAAGGDNMNVNDGDRDHIVLVLIKNWDNTWFRNVLTMSLLTTVNLLNYMDRLSVAGQISAF